ncbi:hypothetical protein PCANC_13358 [Puccinia coronata f. sp. avenae]|uniref:Uncharacterized protein n=1 Tax=Puccinia coronata f. sp. avenae TaxID=200324 RepID=A0A2N5STW1_9BASI|nr:hypothetical protein PCANC_13358 [Puccinia coronata f. sp. avenae]
MVYTAKAVVSVACIRHYIRPFCPTLHRPPTDASSQRCYIASSITDGIWMRHIIDLRQYYVGARDSTGDPISNARLKHNCIDMTSTPVVILSEYIDTTSARLDATSALLDTTSAWVEATSALADSTSVWADSISVQADSTSVQVDSTSVKSIVPSTVSSLV